MIPLVDLKAQYRSIGRELEEAVCAVLASGEYILGREVQAFEQEFSRYAGGGTVVAMNSGTSALHLALLAAGIGRGDEVITTPMTFIATASAIDYAGARPVFVDIDPETWVMDPAKIEAAITPRTRAIIPVHLHGRLADMKSIQDIARKRNLIVIEDAAQSHAAKLGGQYAGGFSDISCFSFYAGKNLGAAGEGGAAVSSNPDYIERMRMLRDWGAKQKYLHTLKGYNYRMEGIQGAVLRVKLRKLEAWTNARQSHAAQYDKALDALGIQRPATPRAAGSHVYHVYAVRVGQRDKVRDAMAAQGVASGIHYPIPVHLQPAFAELGYSRGAFPIAERLADETLSLPMYAELAEADVAKVCTVLASCVGHSG